MTTLVGETLRETTTEGAGLRIEWIDERRVAEETLVVRGGRGEGEAATAEEPDVSTSLTSSTVLIEYLRLWEYLRVAADLDLTGAL